MKEYIERAAALDAAQRAFSDQECDCEVMPDIFAALQRLPAADVTEVRHGYWYDCGSLSCRCSKCGCKNNRETAYCPNCGARMNKEDEHEAG